MKIVKWALVLISALIMLVFMFVWPIDRTPLHEQPFFLEMMATLDTMAPARSGFGKPQTGWAKVNITPDYNMPMAGYKVRDHFDSVHDSLYARIILIKVNGHTAALLNVDLLIFPPDLQDRLMEKLAESDRKFFLYLSATHTHNGVGGWDNSLAGKLALGDYHPDWIEDTADKIVMAMTQEPMLPSSMTYWESEASDIVMNRLAHEKGEKDGKLRGLIIEREDSTKACLFSFSAHATSINKTNYSLSADYPGRFIKQLEQQFDFGMYMAGMVGSHSFDYLPESDYELVELESALLSEKFLKRKEGVTLDSISMSLAHLPIEFGPSQLRIDQDWKARNWVLSVLFGKLKGELTYLRLGDIIMVGTPCDFSGEISVRDGLESFATEQKRHLMITSFNGNYTGYISYDGHYDSINHDEVRIMNWVGPYYGKYYGAMIKKLLSMEKTEH